MQQGTSKILGIFWVYRSLKIHQTNLLMEIIVAHTPYIEHKDFPLLCNKKKQTSNNSSIDTTMLTKNSLKNTRMTGDDMEIEKKCSENEAVAKVNN
jgi:hypothetical protein